jgi:hypothetical protein
MQTLILGKAVGSSPTSPTPLLCDATGRLLTASTPSNALATYGAASGAFAIAATPTDVFTIYGATGKIVRVTHLEVTGTATAAGLIDLLLISRLAVDSGGTAANPAAVALDQSNAAAVATVTSYTGNPAGLGSSNGPLASRRLSVPAAAPPAWAIAPVVFDWGALDQPVVLRAPAQGLCVNFAGAAVPAGLTLNISIRWTEE